MSILRTWVQNIRKSERNFKISTFEMILEPQPHFGVLVAEVGVSISPVTPGRPNRSAFCFDRGFEGGEIFRFFEEKQQIL